MVSHGFLPILCLIFLPIQSPFLLLPYVDNFICFSGNGMIVAMIEPHIKNNAGGTQMDVVVAFLTMGGCYMLTTPIWGYVRTNNKELFLVQYVIGTVLYMEKSSSGPWT